MIISKLEECFEENTDIISSKNNQSGKNEENELVFKNLYPKCEPNLGKRGLYDMIGGEKGELNDKMAIFWVLSFSDGKNSLSDIAKRSKMKFKDVKAAADRLSKNGLIQQIEKN